MKWLTDLKQSEYPTDFLVARLKGRWAGLVNDWDTLAAADNPVDFLRDTHIHHFFIEYGREGGWIFLYHEFRWVLTKMNKKLRRRFVPFFLYFELQNLIACLRHRWNRSSRDMIASGLSRNLFDRALQDLLLADLPLERVLELIAERLAFLAPVVCGLDTKSYAKAGLAFEQEAMNHFFAMVHESSLHAVLRLFFVLLIDLRNIVTLQKALRWQLEKEPFFLAGGNIAVSHLCSVFAHKDIEAVAKLAGLGSNDADTSISAAGIEKVLLSGLTKNIKKNAYEPSGMGFILFYLWEQYRYVRNLSTLLYNASLAREQTAVGLV